jgi:hypothetical protein
MALKISDTWLKKQAAPVAGATTFWDSDIPGFGLRVFAPTKRHAAGARSFFVNYRIGGREKRFTIGSYPDWSAEAARGEAKDLWRRIDRGEDPALARKTQREAPTVRDLAERYRVEHLANKAKSSQINDWAMVRGSSPALSKKTSAQSAQPPPSFRNSRENRLWARSKRMDMASAGPSLGTPYSQTF